MKTGKISALFLLSTIALLSFKTPSYLHKSEKCPDLIVKEISRPDYVSEIKGSVIQVTIQNIGKAASTETKAKIYDLDIGVEEAKKLGLEGFLIELIEENVSRAKSNKKNYPNDSSITEFDYDLYVEAVQVIPSIKPNKSVTITFKIEGHWVYDSNCELEVEVDFENTVNECNEENNKNQFFAWG